MNPKGRFADVVAGDVPGDQMADKLRKMMPRTAPDEGAKETAQCHSNVAMIIVSATDER